MTRALVPPPPPFLLTDSAYQVSSLKVSDLFFKLERSAASVGFTDWGVSQTTLEDVFLTMAGVGGGGM